MPATEFTLIASLTGGILIGIAGMLLFAFNGRIAGISGILGSILPPRLQTGRLLEGLAFVIGLLVALPAYAFVSGTTPQTSITSNIILLCIGGFLVGLGANLANGCTSGHGVSGISRLSKRSIVATATFMITAVATLWVLRHLLEVS